MQRLLHQLAINESWKRFLFPALFDWCFISPIIIAVGIGIVIEIFRWRIMVATTLLMVTTPHIVREYNLSFLVNISCKATLTPTLRTNISVPSLYFCRWNLYSLIRLCTCCTLHFLHFCTCLAQNAASFVQECKKCKVQTVQGGGSTSVLSHNCLACL